MKDIEINVAAAPPKPDDGGPAFPSQSGFVVGEQKILNVEGGMSLRDFFAAKAMQGLLADTEYVPPILATDVVEDDAKGTYIRHDGFGHFYETHNVAWAREQGSKLYRVVTTPIERMGRIAYAYADAMLKARQQ